MKVKIKNTSGNELPKYETAGSAGVDLRASLNEDVTLKPLERALIKTGIFLDMEEGYEAQVRPRSGLALKHGITIPNSPGTLDSDYKKEVGVILLNLSSENFTVSNGDRIAQLVFAKVEQAELIETEVIEDTGRGGFGSTGIK